MKKILILMAFGLMNLAVGGETLILQPESVEITPVTINKIVAWVNKRVITQNELQEQLIQARQNLISRGIKNYSESDIAHQVLDQMVLQAIQLELAAKTGIKTSDSEVNQAINNIASSQGLSLAGLKQKLLSQNTSYALFREQVKNQITVEKLKQREVDAKVYVNNDEVERVLNSETYQKQVDYKLSDIVIGIPEQPTQVAIEQKETLANQVYSQLKAGANFPQLAVKYSTAPNSLSGGEMGFKSSAALPPQLVTELVNLKPGDVTRVFKFPVGFFIFKLEEVRKHGDIQMVTQYHVRHILIKVNELVSEDEAKHKIDTIYQDLSKLRNDLAQESQEFVELAKEYSDDTSSINGGDLGWLAPGDTVPQFESVILNSRLNTISKPFRSPFGWHILEVLGIKQSNLTTAKEKADVLRALRENKANMLYAEWIRNLREMSYVKINED